MSPLAVTNVSAVSSKFRLTFSTTSHPFVCPVLIEQGMAQRTLPQAGGVGGLLLWAHAICLLAPTCPLVAVLTALHSLPGPCSSWRCFRSCCAWKQAVDASILGAHNVDTSDSCACQSGTKLLLLGASRRVFAGLCYTSRLHQHLQG